MKSLKKFWRRITQGAQRVGNFQAHLLLTIFYLLLIVPIGMISKFGGDLLELRYPAKIQSYWQFRPTKRDKLRAARRQG